MREDESEISFSSNTIHYYVIFNCNERPTFPHVIDQNTQCLDQTAPGPAPLYNVQCTYTREYVYVFVCISMCVYVFVCAMVMLGVFSYGFYRRAYSAMVSDQSLQ